MTPDIRPPSATSNPIPSGPATRPTDPVSLALQLLRPIDAQLLPEGESVRAEVVRSTASGNQFELLLRLAQAGTALPREINTSSPQPLPAGTQVVVQALSEARLLATLQPAASSSQNVPQPALTRLDPTQFPPGSTLQARVLKQQPLAGEQQRFAVLARIIQGTATGATLSLTSPRPVEPGSLLNATIGQAGELRVHSGTEQQRQLDLFQGLRDSMLRQGSVEPLMGILDKLASGNNPQVPTTLQPAIRQVLLHLSSIEQLSTETGVSRAIRQSGLFLENNLAMLANALKTNPPASPAGQMPAQSDPLLASNPPAAGSVPPLTKLLPLLASLPTPPGVEPLPGADLKATLLNLLVSLQQQAPHLSLRALGFPPAPWQQTVAKPGMFPLPSRVLQTLGEAPDLGSLLRLTAALLSRIQHHQFQSLGQSQTFSDGSSQTVWQLDIPLREGQQFSHVQVRIQRDDPAPDRQKGEQTPYWEVRLAFNFDQLGPLQAIARLHKGRVSSEFWAEQPGMLKLLDSELHQLRDRLLAKGLDVGELSYHQGQPPQPRHSVQQRWIDEVT